MNIYFFPNPKSYRNSKVFENPYCYNYMETLSKYYHIINIEDKSNMPSILKIVKSIFRMDVFIVNWPENIPFFRGGKIQTFIYVLLLYFMSIRRVKIIWMFHNLQSHSTDNKYTQFVFKKMYKFSTLIITHSKEALSYLNDKTTAKRLFFNHPIKEFGFDNYNRNEMCNKFIDILIWGTILPYKGIKEFLHFIYSKNLQNKYNIIIVGKCNDFQYSLELNEYCNEMIHFENRPITFDELGFLIKQSRYVLFPYIGESISSSGALIDTLVMNGTPIGPNRGAFKDLNEESICLTYDDYEALLDILDGDNRISEERRSQFILNNSWESFVKNIVIEINTLMFNNV